MGVLFTAAEAWNGGFYELAIELGPRSDKRLQAALETVWGDSALDGCYIDSHIEPFQQPRIPPTLDARLLGVATLPDGQQVACGTFTVREDSGPDWIGFYFPMGALATAYNVGAYPFGFGDNGSSHSWQEPLDAWLVRLASVVFLTVPFPLALIGHEVSGVAYAEEMQRNGIPEERWIGYLWREENCLAWYPANKYDADYG